MAVEQVGLGLSGVDSIDTVVPVSGTLPNPITEAPAHRPTRWLSIANPVAGFSPSRAQDLLRRLQFLGYEIHTLDTVPDPGTRTDLIQKKLHDLRPSPDNPLGVLALGGDGTLTDVVSGVMVYLFGSLSELWEMSVDAIAGRMQASSIYLGVFGLGTANDVANLIGAPGAKINEAIRYLDQAPYGHLNLGIYHLGDSSQSALFPHVLSAGRLSAELFTRTTHERGVKAYLKRLGVAPALMLRGRRPTGVTGQIRDEAFTDQIEEVMLHPIPRAGGAFSFPGTPTRGVGVKILAFRGYWQKERLILDSVLRALSSRWGRPGSIGSDERLAGLDGAYQQQLLPGDRLNLEFAAPVPVQSGGDFIASATLLSTRVLPPFPNVLMMGGSILAQAQAIKGPVQPRISKPRINEPWDEATLQRQLSQQLAKLLHRDEVQLAAVIQAKFARIMPAVRSDLLRAALRLPSYSLNGEGRMNIYDTYELRNGFIAIRLLDIPWHEFEALLPGAYGYYRCRARIQTDSNLYPINFGYPYQGFPLDPTTLTPDFLRTMAIGHGDVVLDPLAGAGTQVIPLAAKHPTAHFLAMEVNPDNLVSMYEKLEGASVPIPNLQLIPGSIFGKLPFTRDSLTHVTFNSWATFGLDDQELQSFYQTLFESLSSGGRVWYDYRGYNTQPPRHDIGVMLNMLDHLRLTYDSLPIEDKSLNAIALRINKPGANRDDDLAPSRPSSNPSSPPGRLAMPFPITDQPGPAPTGLAIIDRSTETTADGQSPGTMDNHHTHRARTGPTRVPALVQSRGARIRLAYNL